ncbi:prolyl-tRNA synthetase [Tilletiaria anomala UBC 951]|uniref:proline--tRNA ligase n=1 Tax=Tilletiaria anomala (strain ATCC 24038 / CBS 436.72 / UBC 951) TaxID=1037660 RepID=A0A066WEA6_TILAU|nr:prolyl-tRNA synthetase [Tilletiaria anomala UBC 951]KDN52111.1 prolyl-tRNA synthetase [Tilletiaria anomala UBC 951]
MFLLHSTRTKPLGDSAHLVDLPRCVTCRRPSRVPHSTIRFASADSKAAALIERPPHEQVVRLSRLFLPTFNAESLSTSKAALPSLGLLLRGGFARQSSAGIYTLLPMGLRVVQKISAIIEDEMNGIGASRLEMPTLLSSALWYKSGRWKSMGSELFRLKGRGGSEYLLAPTHEEEVTRLVADEVQSHRQLPVKVYQITRKYRDEPRPRSGLMRTREFYMKDLYTFDADEARARESYEQVRGAYSRILDRLLGANHGAWLAAAADTGAIGGDLSHEYQIEDELGEDTILKCSTCAHAANQELAQSSPRHDPSVLPISAQDLRVELYELANDPAGLNAADSDAAFQIAAERSPARLWAVVVPRDRSISPVQLRKAAAQDLQPLHKSSHCTQPGQFSASFDKVTVLTDAECSAVEAQEVCDAVAAGISALLNEDHGTSAGAAPSLEDFFPPVQSLQASALVDVPFMTESSIELSYGNYREAADGDACSSCAAQGRAGTLVASKAIEVGHTFLLGAKYSDALQVGFTPAAADAANSPASSSQRRVPFQMGCYGLGISRLLGAIAQRSATLGGQHGFVWPRSMAPFQVCIIANGSNADGLAQVLQALFHRPGKVTGCSSDHPVVANDVAIDDREELSISRRLKDANLIGFPVVVVIGKAWREKRHVEVIIRDAQSVDGTIKCETTLIALD